MQNDIINTVRNELKLNSSAAVRLSAKKFFKEEAKHYGVKSAVVGEIAAKSFRDVESFGKKEIFSLCEELFMSDYSEEAYVASDWAYRLRKDFKPEDFKIFERWINSYINNWAKCDTFCNHTVGAFVELYPKYLKDLTIWAKSENRWVRRASAVTLILPARHGKFLKDVFEIADLLLTDQDDMVQKGYGWMLKAASEAHQREVFQYVMKNKKAMPRTALRYAIEKMPQALRKSAMVK
jgi:3-methyladenine DNA glycosylase AlkD